MATGITIQSASYGAGSTTEDATDGVVSQVKNGIVNFVVSPSALNVDDPAIGQTKTLTVKYTINDGETNTISAVDGETLKIDAPPERMATGLNLKNAEYGYDTNWQDVTSAVRTYVNDGKIDITVSPSAVGIPDPNPQKKKFLKLDLEINGTPSSYNVDNGKRFTLSAPAAVSVKQGRPNTAWSVISMIFGKIVWCLMMTIWLCSVRLSADYGQKLFGSGGYYLLGTSALLTWGVFPVLILPIAIFLWSLITGYTQPV
jgi:hypothetical protein